jgi:hypothetical protein
LFFILQIIYDEILSTMPLIIKKQPQLSTLRNQTSNRERIAKAPPFYSVHDDVFYHGPAWVMKSRLFEPKENTIKKPGPGYYHIPDRSIYTRPGT